MRVSVYEFLDSDSANTRLTASRRLKTLLGWKLAMALGLNLWALVPYYWLQHHPFFPVAIMPTIIADEWISFNEAAVWLYLSLFLLMPVAPMQMVSPDDTRRYALGVASMSLLADLVFFLWPTTVLRPNPQMSNIVYQNLTHLVSPNNACPSLHAAMAVFSALCYEQIAPHMRDRQLWRLGLWIWALGIIYATLATKEHVALDAAAGSLLGLIAYLAAFRAKLFAVPMIRKGR
ncbi:MAG TPA: phosphatase PAP2 family protein [Candidatus Udaeobacter sp.]|nr:phosphatase PAP2 family protein [Candidatus Udaeobacter sp.]